MASVSAREQRAIVTLDTDLSDIRTYPPRRYSGIVVLRLNDQARDHILEVGRDALRRGDIHTASRMARVYKLTPVEIQLDAS